MTVAGATATSFEAADGSLPGTIDITGADAELKVAGTETIDNVTINVGYGYYYYYYYNANGIDGDNGSDLTLGPNVIVNQISQSASFQSYGSIDFKGVLNAGALNGAFYIYDYTQPFTNDGSILISNNEQVTDYYGFVNSATGTISVIGGGMAIAQYGSAWSNAGAITVGTGGTLTLGGTFTVAGAGDIVNDGGFIRISGTLNNTGSPMRRARASFRN